MRNENDKTKRNKMKEKTIKSELLYRGRIISLFRDIVKIKGRKTVRELITHPGSSVILPVLDVKKKIIVLIRQYRYAAKSPTLELPAGTRKRGEPALTCARREIIEETGYSAAKMKLISGFMPSPGIMSEQMSLFIAAGLIKTRQALDFDEQISVLKVTLKKAVAMVFSGKIKDAKTIAGVLMLNEVYRDKNLYKKYLSG
jgi:ADP-ribose pyrophosphatase